MFAELRSWAEDNIGRTERFDLGVITPLMAQRYAMAIDDLNPLYFDADFARNHGYRGIIAPPNYIATLRGEQAAGPADGELLADGMAASARPPLPKLMGMGGGQALEFHAPVHCGEHIFGERTITGVNQKEGRSGPLVIIEDEIRYATHAGEPRVTLRNTLLCRWVDAA